MVEHAFNMDGATAGPPIYLTPGAGDLAGLPGIDWLDDGQGGRTLRIEYIRRIGSGLTYVPMFGDTFGDGAWMPADGLETVTPIDAEWERCVIEDPGAGPTELRRFGRVGISW